MFWPFRRYRPRHPDVIAREMLARYIAMYPRNGASACRAYHILRNP